MMFSYHSLTDLEKSLLENESRTESRTESENMSPITGKYICFTNVKYIFYLLYLCMVILFLIFIIIIIITKYTDDP